VSKAKAPRTSTFLKAEFYDADLIYLDEEIRYFKRNPLKNKYHGTYLAALEDIFLALKLLRCRASE
jgi:hypothetical protein